MIDIVENEVVESVGDATAKIASYKITLEIDRDESGTRGECKITFENRKYSPFGTMELPTTTVGSAEMKPEQVQAILEAMVSVYCEKWAYEEPKVEQEVVIEPIY